MEKSKPHSEVPPKRLKVEKVNPKSKKIPISRDKQKFVEDDFKKVQPLQKTPNQFGRIPLNLKKRKISSEETNLQDKDHTERKVPLNSKRASNEERTGPKKKKELKRTINSKKVSEDYIYIYDPQNECMKKHRLIQGQKINSELEKFVEYMPPFHSCDEDCDSSEEIVRRGVERSKRDLLIEIERRKNLQKHSKINNQPRRQIFSDSGQQTDDEKETEIEKVTK